MPIYFRQGDELVPMTEQPYEAEDLLQELLAKYPGLLSGDEDGTSRKWLLIQRELGIASEEDGAGRFSIDHLFVDDQGVPTLVEVKRSSNTEIRRQVVGQLLEYAANASAYWQLDKLRLSFEANCEAKGKDPAEEVAELVDHSDPDAFWEQVRTNLAAGKLRLVFVADHIPSELARIVEFLNEQMSTTEVIALEVKQYLEKDGERQTLVPRIVGRTERAPKRRPGPRFKTIAELKGQVQDETIRSWVDYLPKRLEELFPDAEVRLDIPGTGDGSLSINGKERLGWWYAQHHLFAWSYRFEGDEELLRGANLSRPGKVKIMEDVEGDYIRFHVRTEDDLKVFEEVARRAYEQATA
jgi:hypothetical protein